MKELPFIPTPHPEQPSSVTALVPYATPQSVIRVDEAHPTTTGILLATAAMLNRNTPVSRRAFMLGSFGAVAAVLNACSGEVSNPNSREAQIVNLTKVQGTPKESYDIGQSLTVINYSNAQINKDAFQDMVQAILAFQQETHPQGREGHVNADGTITWVPFEPVLELNTAPATYNIVDVTGWPVQLPPALISRMQLDSSSSNFTIHIAGEQAKVVDQPVLTSAFVKAPPNEEASNVYEYWRPLVTEACQATSVGRNKLSNEDRLSNAAQEFLCNGFSTAWQAAVKGISYDDYLTQLAGINEDRVNRRHINSMTGTIIPLSSVSKEMYTRLATIPPLVQ